MHLVIDGSHGEGGGQILRTAVGAAALTGRGVRFERIRANRKNPGLAAQHLTAVKAVARLCNARLEGATLGSTKLTFEPQSTPIACHVDIDVAAARRGGSAGSAALVLQAMIPALLTTDGRSTIRVAGGTHTAWSPPFDYLRDVWAAALERMGARVDVEMARWGWYPAGRGQLEARVEGTAGGSLAPFTFVEPGRLRQVRGRAVTSRLLDHIADRMANTARSLLADRGIGDLEIRVERPDAACPGAGIFLTGEYQNVSIGSSALGKRGISAEKVACEAVEELLEQHRSGTAVDPHLADQLLLPAALARIPSELTTSRLTKHITTNAWVIEQFGLARFEIAKSRGGHHIRIVPANPHPLFT